MKHMWDVFVVWQLCLLLFKKYRKELLTFQMENMILLNWPVEQYKNFNIAFLRNGNQWHTYNYIQGLAKVHEDTNRSIRYIWNTKAKKQKSQCTTLLYHLSYKCSSVLILPISHQILFKKQESQERI